MGDRGHNRHGPKTGGGLLCPVRGELIPRIIQCGLGRGLLLYHLLSSSIQPFGHNRHEPKTAQTTFLWMETQLPFPKRGRSPLPNFRPMPIVAKRLDGSRWHLVWRWALFQATLCWMGTRLPSPKKGSRAPIFGPFYCGQTAGCIKMSLGMEVGLGPGDFVLDGDPAPSPKRGGAPNLRPTSIAAKRLHGSTCHLVRR